MFRLLLFLAFAATMGMAASCNTKQDTSEQAGVTEQDTALGDTMNTNNLSVNEDGTRSSYDRNPNWYVYDYQDNVETGSGADMPDESLEASDVRKTNPSGGKRVTTSGEGETAKAVKPVVKKRAAIYTLSETDRPPIFTAACMNDKNPDKCSNEELEDWLRGKIKYPQADLADGSDGLEHVTFVINQRGEISSIERVDTRNEDCTGCAKAALDAISQMPAWQPAMLDGKPVSVRVTLPVRFRNL